MAPIQRWGAGGVVKITEAIKKIVDPAGPIGEVLSPADVYKSRLGLPTTTPQVQRDTGFLPIEERFLAPQRFVAADAVVAPASRVRQVSRYVEEHYSPVYDTPRSSGLAEALRASTTVVGYNIRQVARTPYCDCRSARLTLEDGQLVHRACGRARKKVAAEDFVEHVRTLQLAPSDEFYNTFYPTIPGPDAVQTDAGLAKGGTQIRGGRREWREKTDGWVVWDKGVVKEREKAYAAEQQKWIDGVRPLAERALARLPRKLGEV
jgi:hypothetical protein